MKVGLQTYTVRNSFKRNPMETLEKISESGYKFVELVNHNADKDPGTGFGIPASQLKKKVDEVGIKIIGTHIQPDMNKMDEFYRKEDNIKAIIEYYNLLGSTYIVNALDFFPTKDHLLKRCEVYNRIGEIFSKNGMRFLYHSHYHEFQRFEGENILDLIIDNTDPKYMGIELDVYWVIRAALDPVEKIHQYSNRIDLIHQKDFPFNQVQNPTTWLLKDLDKPVNWDSFNNRISPEQYIEIGDGMIKIQDIIDACNEYNIPYILVEQDYSAIGEIESIKRSMFNLKKMRGLDWD